ncbi:MAG: TIGR00730 family Rossman fold protein [Rubrobacteraceae bacterium]
MNSICVFCGSSLGNNSSYAEAARSLGVTLAEKGITLIYGGGHVGLMGAVADATLKAGGEVIGVMPRALVDREIAHERITRLHVVGSMHERKALMSELSDGFVALPGGNGTLEEFFEVLTWAQLGEHKKPCGLLNAGGYYEPLIAVFDHMVNEGFLSEEHRSIVQVRRTPNAVLDALSRYVPPAIPKWIKETET